MPSPRSPDRAVEEPVHSPPRPALWPAAVQYAAAVVLIFACTSAFLGVAAWLRSGGHPDQMASEATRFAFSAYGVMGAALVSAVVLAAIALLSQARRGPDLRRTLRVGPTGATPAGLFAAVLGMAGLSIACGAASDALGLREHGTLEAIAHALEGLSPAGVTFGVATVAVAPGVAEELFFRGLIETRLVARWGPWRAIVVTAAGFGLLHFDVVQGALAFLAGLFLGWLTERFGGVRPAMAAHAFNNAIFVLLASLGSDEGPSRARNVVAISGGTLVCVACVAFLRSERAARRPPDSPRGEKLHEAGY